MVCREVWFDNLGVPSAIPPVNREVSHQYKNDDDTEHVITLWVRASKWWRHLPSLRPDKFVTCGFVDLLRYVGILRLQMQSYFIIWKRIDDMFAIVFVLVRNLPIVNFMYRGVQK
jgi:hypothetical protein